MIDPRGIWCRWRSLKGEVPFKKIGFQRRSVKGSVRIIAELGSFLKNALHSWCFGAEGRERHR